MIFLLAALQHLEEVPEAVGNLHVCIERRGRHRTHPGTANTYLGAVEVIVRVKIFHLLGVKDDLLDHLKVKDIHRSVLNDPKCPDMTNRQMMTMMQLYVN